MATFNWEQETRAVYKVSYDLRNRLDFTGFKIEDSHLTFYMIGGEFYLRPCEIDLMIRARVGFWRNPRPYARWEGSGTYEGCSKCAGDCLCALDGFVLDAAVDTCDSGEIFGQIDTSSEIEFQLSKTKRLWNKKITARHIYQLCLIAVVGMWANGEGKSLPSCGRRDGVLSLLIRINPGIVLDLHKSIKYDPKLDETHKEKCYSLLYELCHTASSMFDAGNYDTRLFGPNMKFGLHQLVLSACEVEGHESIDEKDLLKWLDDVEKFAHNPKIFYPRYSW